MQIKSECHIWKCENRNLLLLLALKHRSHSFGNLRKKKRYASLVKSWFSASLHNRYHQQSFTFTARSELNLLTDNNMSGSNTRFSNCANINTSKLIDTLCINTLPNNVALHFRNLGEYQDQSEFLDDYRPLTEAECFDYALTH